MTEEDFEKIQKGYERLILEFLQKHRQGLAIRKNPSYQLIQQKIKAVEESVLLIFKTKKQEEEPPTSESPIYAEEETNTTSDKEAIPTTLYPEQKTSSAPILVDKLSIGLFLNIQKDQEKLSIPISFFSKKSKEDIAAFLTIYSKHIDIGFGLTYNGLPWNIGSDGNSFQFESALIGVWFEGVKQILKGDKQVSIEYSKKSKAYIQRLDAKYILLADVGLAPLIQVSLDDFLPSFLTACIKYLSFLDKMQPVLEQLLKENIKLHPNIIQDLDMPTFRQRVRHLRRNLYSSSFF